MGNTSSTEQWAGRERLVFVERLAWWRGMVNRGDLQALFGISQAQASADLRAYQALNPQALVYQLSRKRYEAQAAMTCLLHEPHLEEAVRTFLGVSVPPALARAVPEDGKVDLFVAPARKATPEVERRVFLAMDSGRRLRVKYWSVHSSGAKWRQIAPHALAHDGCRWHVRAWCSENEDYRDFVLSRIEETDWPFDHEPAPPMTDEEWERRVPLVLRANRGLDEEQRKSIERDYGIKRGKLTIQVREAMREYYLAQLRIPETVMDRRPQHLELEE